MANISKLPWAKVEMCQDAEVKVGTNAAQKEVPAASSPFSTPARMICESSKPSELRPGEHRLGGGELLGRDHLDVALDRLHDRGLGALVLAVDELGRAVGHQLGLEGRARDGVGELG